MQILPNLEATVGGIWYSFYIPLSANCSWYNVPPIQPSSQYSHIFGHSDSHSTLSYSTLHKSKQLRFGSVLCPLFQLTIVLTGLKHPWSPTTVDMCLSIFAISCTGSDSLEFTTTSPLTFLLRLEI